MILNKRIFRDLKANFMRYFAVFCVVAIAMYVVIGMSGAAETVISGVEKCAEQNMVEDGQFVLFVPLSKSEYESFEDSGVTLEEHFNLDFFVDDTVLRVFKNRDLIDLVSLDEGRMPEEDNEIVLEKHYFNARNFSLGDSITVGDTEFKIVGYGSSPDYDDVLQSFADASSKHERFGTSFVTSKAYDDLLNSGMSQSAEEYLYSYRLNGSQTIDEFLEKLEEINFDISGINDKYALEYFEKYEKAKDDFSDGVAELLSGTDEMSDACNDMYDGVNEFSEAISLVIGMMPQLKEPTDELVDSSDKLLYAASELQEGAEKLDSSFAEFSDEYLDFTYKNLKKHVSKEDNPRIYASSNDIQINKNGALIAGVIILVLLAYVLSSFATNSIETERKIIGTLYAMGFVKRELLRNYVILPVLICTIGGLVGTVLGFAGMESQVADNSVYFSYPILKSEYPIFLILYGIAVPFLMALIVNTVVINKKLSQEPLTLMSKQQNNYTGKAQDLGKMKFINRFRLKLFTREIKSNLTIVVGIFISLLLVMLAVTIYSATTTIIEETNRDVKFNYMYYLSYPEEEAPEYTEQAYHEKYSKERMGYNFEVSILGIANSSEAFPFDISTTKNEVYISTSVAEKYELNVGDNLDLTDSIEGITYNFEVKQIVDYAPGLFVFMDIDSMRDRFGKEDDYYNVLISNEQLDIETGRVYSMVSGQDLRDASEIFWSLMKKLVYVLVFASVIMFVLVMYLMVKMIIERQTNNISLFKLFGYSKAEVSKLYLRNNTYIVIISSLIFIPITKWIIVLIYPYLTSNRAVGFNLSFSKEIFIFLALVIAVSYLISYALAVLKLNKVEAQEVLKERE